MRRPWVLLLLAVGGIVGCGASALAQAPPEIIEYYATDALGSVRVVYHGTGQVLGRSDYLPFGETLNQSGALPRQRFTGQERDGEAGLDYFNARDLQTRTGRMNVPDPLFGNAMMSPQRWNRYSYVVNNPLRATDPTGMDLVDPNAAINAFYQQVWGTMAWDDFSNDYWTQGTNYSYGPFSPKQVAESARWANRETGPTGEVTTSISDARISPDAPAQDPAIVIQATAIGAGAGVTVVAVGSVVVDAATGGLNIAATPAELAVGASVGGVIGWGCAVVVDAFDRFVLGVFDNIFAREHTSGARPSTQEKHEDGQARKSRDQGGERADWPDGPRRPPRQRPDNWKGPWPPKTERR
jgi:RHS repeat-associated protein